MQGRNKYPVDDERLEAEIGRMERRVGHMSFHARALLLSRCAVVVGA